MAQQTDRTVAFLVAPEGVEQIELTEPWTAVEEEGWTPRLVSTRSGRVQALHHLDKGDTFEVDNPDALRLDKQAVDFVRAYVNSGRPVAAICHAPWTLIEADVVRGRTLTSWPSLQTDLRNAGATWVDEEVVVDGSLVSSRKPDDLPAFIEEMLALFAR
jgi:protease I